MLLAAIATLLAATVQSATGFGFALVLSPVLFATLEPTEAVGALLVLGIAMNLLMLVGERREREVRTGDALTLVAAAVPGLVVGALTLAALPRPALQVAVGATVIAAAGAQASLRARGSRPRMGGEPRTGGRSRTGGRLSAYAVGFASGALTTSTSISGPPLVLWLSARGATPNELRDSLSACFLALNLLGALVLVLVVGTGAIDRPAAVLALLPLVVVGYLAGRAAFRRMDAARYQAIVLVAVAVAGLASVVAGLWGV